MPKLPVLRAREIIKALKKLGFFEHRQRGTSHLILKHPNGRRVSVPVHPGKDVKPGTLRGMLEDGDISKDEFHKAL